MEEERDDLTLLIDSDSLIYFVAHLETVEEAILKLDKRIYDILEANNTNKYVMFLTGKDCFRYSIAKSAPYKGNRKDREKPKWLGVITQYMIAQYKAVYYKGLEADDGTTIFANKIPNSRIVAIDKDILYTTEGTHYNYGMEKVPGTVPQEWRVKGFVTVTKEEAERARDIFILTGDPGTDNIPGLKGIGAAKAEKILDVYKIENEGLNSTSTALECFIDKHGMSEGICRFAESFRLTHMLRNDEDCLREIGYIPELPEIQTYIGSVEIEEPTADWD